MNANHHLGRVALRAWQIRLVVMGASMIAMSDVQAQFSSGARVRCTQDNVNVRSSTSTSSSSNIRGQVHTGYTGTVYAGPFSGSGWTWYDIDWDNGLYGYTAVNYLQTLAASPPGSFSLSNDAPYWSGGPVVQLNWSSSSGATSYDLYRNGSLYSSNISGTSFINSASLNAGQTYSYFVVAKNSGGTRQSNTINVTMPSAPVSPPGSFTLSNNAPYWNGGPVVQLNWSSSSGATSYDLYRNGSLYSSNISGTSFINSASLNASQTYSYYMIAKNSGGTRQSNTINVTMPSAPPSSPAPAVSSISPNPVLGSNSRQTVSILGSDFKSGCTVTLTWTGQSSYALPAAQLTFVSSSRLDMSITTGTIADSWTAKVTNPDGKSSSAQPFQVITPSLAAITNPVDGSTLSSGTATFNWSAGSGVSQYALYVGSTSGGYDLHYSGYVTALSRTVSVPTDGRTLYVSLYSNIGGSWQARSYTYTAYAPPPPAPVITSISPNPVLGSNSRQTVSILGSNFKSGCAVTLTWTGQSSYSLPAAQLMFVSSSRLDMSITTGTVPDSWSAKVTNPDGKPSNTQPFQVSTPALASITSPADGSTLTSGTATFTWNSGTGVTQYALYVGSTAGGYDLYYSGYVTALSRTVTVPTDGRKLYVSLYSNIGGSWQAKSYTFNAYAPPMPAPVIASINPNPVMGTNSRQTVSILGSGFQRTPSITLTWTGQPNYALPAAQLTYVSTTRLDMSITTGTMPDAWSAKVTNPDGKPSNVQPFQVSTPALASITSPADGSTLSSGTATFTWNSGTGVSQYALYVGSTAGGYDLHYSGYVTALSRTVTVPTDGRKLYVSLYSNLNGSWQARSYTFNAYAPPTAAPVIAGISPNPVLGSASRQTVSILGSNFQRNSSITLSWTGQPNYPLPAPQMTYMGTGRLDMSITTSTASDTWTAKVTNPDGKPSNVLPFQVSAPALAQITTPPDGATLGSTNITFNWSAGTGVTKYSLYVGSTAGGHDLYYSGHTTERSKTVSLPANGAKVYATLYSQIGGSWVKNTTVSYTAPTAKPGAITSHTDGTVLASGSDTLMWDAGIGASQYSVYVGSSPGAYDLGYSNWITKNSYTLPNLKADGRRIYITLHSNIGGAIKAQSSTYVLPGGTPVVLFLHGMNSDEGAWSSLLMELGYQYYAGDGVFLPDWNRIGVIYAGQRISKSLLGSPGIAQPDTNGVRYYAIRFGSVDSTSPHRGLDVSHGGDAGQDGTVPETLAPSGYSKGDFMDFDGLGNEVWNAVNLILGEHPNARITLVGHSRGGLSARAFLQNFTGATSVRTKINRIDGLLTIGTPHHGSRFGRLYEYLRTNPRSDNLFFNTNADKDWDTADLVDLFMHVGRPVIKFVADDSAQMQTLNSKAGSLQTYLKFAIIPSNDVNFGIVGALGIRDDLWDNWGKQLTTSSQNFLLEGTSRDAETGDGLVARHRQNMSTLPGFSGTQGNEPSLSNKLHTEQTGQTAAIKNAIQNLLPK